ncbi:MAG TPA: putative metal-dependent hydrolase [Thermoanaerobaculia bacterium]|jgi:uncharacterized damage-inducible protein DinB|nr:putative metal-dependent hydrolase [Thermoanaerobaculia bacterium]
MNDPRDPLADPRYPIGRWDRAATLDAAGVAAAVDTIAAAPARIRAAVTGLSEAQLDTPYRRGGWTVRQVVHHLPDSHVNAYVRCRLALTEEEPLIRAYEEGRWAELDDARSAPVEISLALLSALHQRWVLLLRRLDEADLERAYRHPEMGLVKLRQVLALYAWHCRHHEAHITRLRERRGW